MYTMDEKKNIRKDFWNRFKTYSNKRKLKLNKPGKWIMEATGIKQLKLKFHFDEKLAYTGIIIDTRNLDKRIELFDKLEKLKGELERKVPFQLHWELESNITEKKTISRVIAKKENVNIYNHEHWKEVMSFLFDAMDPMEDIFREYYDFLKY